jgi:uncharacterized protein (DUF2141 family)
MKQLILITLLLFISHSYPLLAQSPGTGTLEIRFTNLRSDVGSMSIGINTSEKGWPRKAEMEFQLKKVNVKDGVFVAQVPNLPFGTMAISVLDDENEDVEMEMTLGIPREGFGFSNDAPIRGLSSPKFEACSFRFEKTGQQISIALRYMGKGK